MMSDDTMEHGERCDLSTYKIRTHGTDGAVSRDYRSISKELNLKNIDEFKIELDKVGVSLTAIIQMIWHKVLNIFGSSRRTILHIIDFEEKISFLQSIEHDTIDYLDLIDAIRCTHVIEVLADNCTNSIPPNPLSTTYKSDSDAVFHCEPSNTDHLLNLYPLQFYFHGEALRIGISFDGLVFDEESLFSFLEVAVYLVEQVSSNPHLPTNLLSTIPPIQVQRMESWNNTDGDYPKHMRLEQLFEEEVKRSRDKIAVNYLGQKYSYQVVNSEANKVARCLGEKLNVIPGQLIGLLLDKDHHSIILLLALWKCGAAAVAIDPGYPDKRIMFSIYDTGITLIISSSFYTARVEKICQEIKGTMDIISLEDIYSISWEMPETNYNLDLSNRDLAYISYTSGTTGTPKGIKKMHVSLVNSITDLSERYEVKGSSMENVVLYSSYVFEPFYRQMLMSLINGHCLHIFDDKLKLDTVRFSKFIEEENITYLNGTPSILQEYDYSNCPHLKRLILVGEQLTTVRYNNLRRKFSGKIICEYGFTESAFVSLLKHFNADDKRSDTSLGKPVRNVKCYILSKDLTLVPEGVIGILYVGGAGVSSGYLNRETLTKERFIPNPFQTKEDLRKDVNITLYKTGDLVSWTRHGEIKFHGRCDFQIKLRGIRIEPGEIETILSSFPGVDRCVVVVRSTSNIDDEAGRVLIAFFTSKDNIKLREKDIITFIEEYLPRFMVPSRIVQINRIPINVNGKVDLKSLPEIPLLPKNISTQSSSDIERAFTEIWSKVLGLEGASISNDDDFFMLGGNSIRCVQAISLIQQQLGLKCSVEDFFNLKKLRLILQEIVKRNDCINEGVAVQNESLSIKGKSNLVDFTTEFVANSMQQSMAYQNIKEETCNGVYTMQSIHEVSASIDPNLFKQSWLLTQQKFSTLRSKFYLKEAVYYVAIDEDCPLNYSYYDCSTTNDYKNCIQDLLVSDREQLYDISKTSLFRVYLVSTPENKSMVLFSCHHIILDGWSLPIMLGFLFDTYIKLLNKQNAIYLVDSAYEDTLVYLERKASVSFAEDTEFWTTELEKLHDRCQLGGILRPDKKKVHLPAYNKVEIQKELEIEVQSSTKLHGFCRRNGLTLNSVLQFVWHQVLSAYGNAQQTVVGTTVSGRNLPLSGIENTVGMIINTLPVVVEHSSTGSESVITAIEKVQTTIKLVNQRSHCWLAKLPTDNFKHELFDSLFIFDVYPSDTICYQQDSFVVKKVYNYDKLDFPLVAVASDNDTVKFKVMFAGEIFDGDCITQMLSLVDYLVTQIITIDNLNVRDLDLLTPSQKDIIGEFNKTEEHYPLHLCLHEIFEMEVERVADKTAVVYRNKSLTYRMLNNLSNQLAKVLITEWELKKGDRVALFQSKSELLIVSILAVWKCGAAFVPIGIDYPCERVEFILQDSNSKLVMTSSEQKETLLNLEISSAKNFLAVQQAKLLKDLATPNVDLDLSSENLAYIIYTSGTTGKPKGVMVQHKGVANLKFAMEELFELKSDNEVILSFSNYIFDHFVEQMNDGILTGQTLLILDDDLRFDKKSLHAYMRQNRVTYLSGTPTVVSQYDITGLPHLRRVDVVGEDLKEETFNKLRAQFSGLIINGYGPTEISITSHKRLYHKGDVRSNKSIGHQIPNSRAFVVNRRQQLLPIGAVGEMLIGGVGVTKGYLNNPDLTQEKFITNIFETQSEDSKVYTTGDLVRWLPNGEIECLGRVDQQVKIRGIRIEIAEIESIIELHPSINQAAVKPVGSSMKNLAAFVSLKPDYIISEEEIKQFVSSKVPFSLIPSRIVIMENLPVSSSGKLNYKMLPEIENMRKNTNFMPKNEVEDRLASLWLTVLNIPSNFLSHELNFFQAGGDSLLVVHLISAVRDAFQVSLTVTDVINYSTIPEQAQLIKGKEDQKPTISKQKYTRVKASGEQEELLFIEERDEGSNAYNIHMMYNLNPSIDVDYLMRSVFVVLEQNIILRTIYTLEEDGFYQSVLSMDDIGTIFSQIEANPNEIDEILVIESKHVFSLSSTPPIRVVLIRVREQLILSVLVHHVAFDGYSASLFEESLEKAYLMISKGAAEHENVLQFADFCRYIMEDRRNQDTSLVLGANENTYYPPTRVSTSFEFNDSNGNKGSKMTLSLAVELLSNLEKLAKLKTVTINCLLTAAFFKTLQKITGQSMISFSTPFGTRTIDFLKTIGFFVTMKQLCLDMDKVENFSSLLECIKDKVLLTPSCTSDAGRESIPIVFASHKGKPDLNKKTVLCSRYNLGAKEYSPAKFDIYFEVVTGIEFKVNVTYNANLYRAKDIKILVDQFADILKSIEHDFGLPQDLHHTGVTPNSMIDLNIGSIFYRIATNSGSKIALVHGERRMTYNELLQMSCELGKILQNEFSVKQGDYIGLYLNKDMNMIIGILAAWMLGAGYVPMDLEHPRDRVNFIVAETKPRVVLCNQDNISTLKSFLSSPIFSIDKDKSEKWDNIRQERSQDFCSSGTVDNIAYIMYTSGTSGIPKGVQISQKNVLSFLAAIEESYSLQNQLDFSTVLFLSNYSFDFSVEQILLSLFRGGTLVLPLDKGPVVFDNDFYRYINASGVDFISGTPSHLALCKLQNLEKLKVLVLAGEGVTAHQFNKFRALYSGVIIQAYGTTETTVYNTYKVYKVGESFTDSVGKTLSNTRAFIMNDEMQEIEEGELCISGDCVSNGYLNRPDENLQSFIDYKDLSLYKTGDIVRMLENGDLQYIERKDFQLSVNGLRIERSEVEIQIMSFRKMTQVHVMLHPTSNILVCFLVANDKVELNHLETYLQQKLPENMIPKIFLQIASLPLTKNGKIDDKSLILLYDQFEHKRRNALGGTDNEGTKIELIVRETWISVLGTTNIGLDDDFFFSGGDSIKSLHLVAELRRNLSTKITVKDVFTNRTIRKLSVVIEERQKHKVITKVGLESTKQNPDKSIPLLPIQKWFFAKDIENSHSWNQCFTIQLPSFNINVLKVEDAVEQIVCNHEEFRYRFSKSRAGWVQFKESHSSVKPNFHIVDAKNMSKESIFKKLAHEQTQFNLEKGPLYTVVCICGEETTLLWFSVHHLLIDTVSWGIIRDELRAIYENKSVNKEKNVSFSNWTNSLYRVVWPTEVKSHWNRIRNKTLKWNNEVRGVLNATTTFASQSKLFFDLETTTKIIQNNVFSAYILMLTSLGRSLETITGFRENYVTLEGHGRESEDEDLSSTLGWFTSMFPVELKVNDNLLESIAFTKNMMNLLPQKGSSYGPIHGYTDGILPKISLNFLGLISKEDSHDWAIVEDFGMSYFPLETAKNLDTFLDITAAVYKGNLKVSVGSRLSKELTDIFTEALHVNIQRLSELNSVDPAPCVSPLQSSSSDNSSDSEMSVPSSYRVDDSAGDDSYEMVISLEQKRLFVLPPGEGGAESYLNNIAPLLQPHYNLYLFNNLYRDRGYPCTIPQLAELYSIHILNIQRTGPVHLLGWSFGGILAFEIAVNLARKGAVVGNVFLIDPFFDVPHAYTECGISPSNAVVDDINVKYRPVKQEIIELFEKTDSRFVLFKMTKPVPNPATKLDCRFFRYYLNEEFNNLDKFLSMNWISKHNVADNHYTWVTNHNAVTKLCYRVFQYMSTDRERLMGV